MGIEPTKLQKHHLDRYVPGDGRRDITEWDRIDGVRAAATTPAEIQKQLVPGDDIIVALKLLAEHRAILDRAEAELLQAALDRKWTWASLGKELGKGTRQAMQQHAKRIRTRCAGGIRPRNRPTPTTTAPDHPPAPVGDSKATSNIESNPAATAAFPEFAPAIDQPAEPEKDTGATQSRTTEPIATPATAAPQRSVTRAEHALAVIRAGKRLRNRWDEPTPCPTCQYDPGNPGGRYEQHQDLKIAWLEPDPDHPGWMKPGQHCTKCQPPQAFPIECAAPTCGAGPILGGTLAIAARTDGHLPAPVIRWLENHGWKTTSHGLHCPDHPPHRRM